MFDIEYLRTFRIFNFAIFDVVVSYLGVFLLSPLLIKLCNKAHFQTTKSFWIWLTLPISVVVHLLVGQETTLTNMIVDPNSYYLAKIVVIGMVLMAFISLKRAKK